MKKVLILTYYWPPGSGPGVQRWLKFCKYLPAFGWQPTVITVKNGSYPSIDKSLLEDVPSDMKVHRTSTFEPFGIYNLLRGRKGKSVEVALASVKSNPSRFAKLANYIRSNFFIPDARLGWNRYSFSKAISVIKNERPDLIITTGPPHSTHLVGEQLQKLFDIPWLADFRDPWTTIYYNQFLLRTKKSNAKDKRLETNVVKHATALLTATPGLKAEFEEQAKATHFLPNGFDEEDFEERAVNYHSHFSIAYIGNFKPIQNVDAFWKALVELVQDETFAAHFKLEITGNVAKEVEDSIHEYGLAPYAKIRPFVPHHESIDRMREAHVLLLPVPQDPGNKLILTGKIFEYLATKRPILSLGPIDGNAAEVLEDCGKDPMLDYGDVEGIKSQIKGHFKSFLASNMPTESGNANYLNYSRKGVTESLAKILSDTVS